MKHWSVNIPTDSKEKESAKHKIDATLHLCKSVQITTVANLRKYKLDMKVSQTLKELATELPDSTFSCASAVTTQLAVYCHRVLQYVVFN